MPTTAQQTAILIALTRDGIPRTPAHISVETGIPKASIRRALSELRMRRDKIGSFVRYTLPRQLAQSTASARVCQFDRRVA